MKKSRTSIILTVLVVFFLFIQLYPVLWLFMASLKPTTELSVAPFALPKAPTLSNYLSIIQEGSVFRYMWNSLKVTVVSLVLIIALSSTAGFALSKFRFTVCKPIYRFFTFGIMIPVQITLIPLFCFYNNMHLLNGSSGVPVGKIRGRNAR